MSARDEPALYCSTSISNFKEKLARRFELPDWHWLRSRGKPAVFFGMYNPVDYLRFLWHCGTKTIFWAGGDILNLRHRPHWRRILALPRARHIVENEVERETLWCMGIKSEIHPCLFDSLGDVEMTFAPSATPHVYMTVHPGREEEYGVPELLVVSELVPEVHFHFYGIEAAAGESRKNVHFHGQVSNERFNAEIRKFHAAIRLNAFDGFAETLAKSIMLGQYPISRIAYPQMDWAPNVLYLLQFLRALKTKTGPNKIARGFWKGKLKKSFNEILGV